MSNTEIEIINMRVMGDIGSGKSALINSFIQSEFSEESSPQESLNGIRIIQRNLPHTNTKVQFRLFENVHPRMQLNMKYSETPIILCVNLATTNIAQELQETTDRINELPRHTSTGQCAPIILVGTQSDKASPQNLRAFERYTHKDVRSENTFITSAKNHKDTKKPFERAEQIIDENKKSCSSVTTSSNTKQPSSPLLRTATEIKTVASASMLLMLSHWVTSVCKKLGSIYHILFPQDHDGPRPGNGPSS